MATVRHAFESLKADPADTSLVGASKYNDDHELDDVESETGAQAKVDAALGDVAGLIATAVAAFLDSHPEFTGGLVVSSDDELVHALRVRSDNEDGAGMKDRFVIENSNPGPVDVDFRNVIVNIGNPEAAVSSAVTFDFFCPPGSSGQYIRMFKPDSTTVTSLYFGVNGNIVQQTLGLMTNAHWVGAAGAAQAVYLLLSSGEILWGPGGATAQDTNLKRSAANSLKTDDQFTAAYGLVGKYVASAGKTNLADGDFTVTPADGATGVAHNTTDGKSYSCARANGTWKSVEVTV